MKILIMGLPGSGKTYTANVIAAHMGFANYNADVLRAAANDWDFSMEGRLRQARRMKALADFEVSNGRTVICDFVCPTPTTRDIFEPNFVIWMNTIEHSRYGDTNKTFVPPERYDIMYTEMLPPEKILDIFDETVKSFLDHERYGQYQESQP